MKSMLACTSRNHLPKQHNACAVNEHSLMKLSSTHWMEDVYAWGRFCNDHPVNLVDVLNQALAIVEDKQEKDESA
jgi:hypothetical protein